MFEMIAFCIVVFIQILYYLIIFGRFSFSKTTNGLPFFQPVSIVICAKNEEKHLREYLPKLIDQDYPKFEIVLVDDTSDDASLAVMLEFKRNYETEQVNIRIIGLDERVTNGKKTALSLGIKSATYDHLLLTDADCQPVSDQWIKEMVSHFSKDKTIVLGYGAYDKLNDSFLNKLIRFETLLTAIQYFSYAKLGMAYMGVGRNIAYDKKEFIRVNGFEQHQALASGDDDLFINQVANDTNTAICTKQNSFTTSSPKLYFKDWLYQKRRHISTSTHYKWNHKLLLGLFYVTNLSFWFLAIILLFLNSNIELIIFLIFLRLTIWYLIISSSAIKLNEKDLIGFATIYEISIIFIQFYIFIQNKIAPPKHW